LDGTKRGTTEVNNNMPTRKEIQEQNEVNNNMPTRKEVKEQQKQHEENMRLPINQFLNVRNEDGSYKFPVAERLRKYFVNNPDPVLDDMRLANALLHELRWRKTMSIKYLSAYNLPEDVEIELKNNKGEPMSKGDCYLSYIAETQSLHIVLSKLRAHITNSLLGKADGTIFTLEQANEFILKVEQKVKELGYTLFPDVVEVIEPL